MKYLLLILILASCHNRKGETAQTEDSLRIARGKDGVLFQYWEEDTAPPKLDTIMLSSAGTSVVANHQIFPIFDTQAILKDTFFINGKEYITTMVYYRKWDSIPYKYVQYFHYPDSNTITNFGNKTIKNP